MAVLPWRAVMRAFHVPDLTPREFVARVTADLRQRDLDRIVSVRLEDDRLAIRFSYLGTSELRYRVRTNGAGFDAEPGGHHIAAFHRPFVERFEDRFERVLEAVGATPR